MLSPSFGIPIMVPTLPVKYGTALTGSDKYTLGTNPKLKSLPTSCAAINDIDGEIVALSPAQIGIKKSICSD